MAISLDTRQIFALLPNAEQNIKTVTPVAVIQKSPEIQTFILISFQTFILLSLQNFNRDLRHFRIYYLNHERPATGP